MCESFFARLECELLDRHRFKTLVEARLAVVRSPTGKIAPNFGDGLVHTHRSLGLQENEPGQMVEQVVFPALHGAHAASLTRRSGHYPPRAAGDRVRVRT